jgi:glycogen debranching enzyme
LEPGRAWQCELDVALPIGPNQPELPRRTFASERDAEAVDPVKEWQDQVPHIHGDSLLLNQVTQTALHDMIGLRILASSGEEQIWLPAAGLPWFLSLFGRDMLITGYQTLALGPVIARGAVLALAHQQGTQRDDFRDEEPGKILHEVRSGELTKLGIKPHSPYYGTADATPLWLVLLCEYWRWTHDEQLIMSLRDNAMAALAWIDHYGDRDRDGYVEYQTRSPQGLGNQCWRDSWDGIQRSDGTIPMLPIATCETQGYVYDAKLRMAELADGPLQDPGLAQRLRGEATALRDRFNRDFWIEERGGYYAVGLDGDKRQIDSLTSNIGHLLWSGIVPPERAPAVVDRLMSDALFSGWGVRTISTLDAGYNPIGYHRGTVWPHDNSIIAAGLTRYGYREQANRVAMGLLDAAPFFGNRLPEALSGYPREDADFPIPYPTACSPQAWASGSPLLCLRSMLDLNARDGRVEVNPFLPTDIGRVLLTGIYAFGQRWDIEAIGTNGDVRLSQAVPAG